MPVTPAFEVHSLVGSGTNDQGAIEGGSVLVFTGGGAVAVWQRSPVPNQWRYDKLFKSKWYVCPNE